MKKLQRLMIDGGFTCPNRDGRVGTRGCTYCRNDAFAPAYCRASGSITAQLEAAKRFFASRYPDMAYLAYFQSYSGTYASPEVLRARYEEALRVPGVVGLVIATRPDCLSDAVLDLLEELSHRVSVCVEVGVESCHDHVLRRIARGHDFACAQDAIQRLAARGLPVGVHIILGLPEESREEMLRGAELLSRLPIASVKLHQLQILRDTPMAEDFRLHPEAFVTFPTAQDYVELAVQFVTRLRADIEVERIVAECPPALLLSPRWGLKPQAVQQLFNSKLTQLL